MRKKLVDLCPQYWENPARYTIDNEEEFVARYEHLGLRQSRFLRLDRLCPAAAPQETELSLLVEDSPETGRGTSP